MIHIAGSEDNLRIGQGDVNKRIMTLYILLGKGGEVHISLENDIDGYGYLTVTEVKGLLIGIAQKLSLETQQVIMSDYLVDTVFGSI